MNLIEKIQSCEKVKEIDSFIGKIFSNEQYKSNLICRLCLDLFFIVISVSFIILSFKIHLMKYGEDFLKAIYKTGKPPIDNLINDSEFLFQYFNLMATSFASIIILSFAFFVILYLSSKINNITFNEALRVNPFSSICKMRTAMISAAVCGGICVVWCLNLFLLTTPLIPTAIIALINISIIFFAYIPNIPNINEISYTTIIFSTIIITVALMMFCQISSKLLNKKTMEN